MNLKWMAAIALTGLFAGSEAQLLGTAESFAVLAGSTVTNAGPTILTGNLGVWPGTAVTGFPPGMVVNGSTHPGDAVAMQAQADLVSAYNVILGEAPTQNLSGQDLGGLTLFAGVYKFNSSAFMTGTLTLDAQGDPNARFDFQIGSTLITASNAIVRVINAGDACNVYWQVGSSATLGTGTQFNGHIMALESITMNTGADILEGNALARNAAVTLDSNEITVCNPVPEPTTFVVVGASFVALAVVRRLRKHEPQTSTRCPE